MANTEMRFSFAICLFTARDDTIASALALAHCDMTCACG